MKDRIIGFIDIGSSRDMAIIFDIDPTVREVAIESIGVMGKFGLDPFEVSKARAISEFVKHASRDKVG